MKVTVKGRDLLRGKQIDLPTGEANLVVVERLARHLIEVEDQHFNHDSAVLLPDRATSGSAARSEVSGLGVVVRTLAFAKANAGRKLLVAGHTDTTGDAAYNLSLSRLRARNVRAALVGDEAEFVLTARTKHRTCDVQEILFWVTRRFGWDCDPGGIDDAYGPATKGAVRRFQREYGLRFEEPIAVDGVVGEQTWKGFFRLYEIELALAARSTAADLKRDRSALKFTTPEFVGCGESHPIEEAAADDFESATNRRVEILFFDPGEEPRFDCHPDETQCKPGRCELFDPVVYRLRPAKPEPAKHASKVDYLLRGNSGCRILPERPFTLERNGELKEGTTDVDGRVLAEGLQSGSWTLTIEGTKVALQSLPVGEASRIHVLSGVYLPASGET